MTVRPRFSLLSLMLVAALVCVSVAFWRLRQEHVALELDHEALKDELGYLAVYDPKMAYVRQGHSEAPLTWKYRVYLPEGKYWLCTKEDRISTPYYAGGSGSAGDCRSGLFTITISFREYEQRWHMALGTGWGGSSGTISNELGEWVSRNRGPRFIYQSHVQHEFAPDKPIPIFRHAKRLPDGSNWGAIVYIDPIHPETRLRQRVAAQARQL